MEFTKIRVIESTFALIRKGISNVLEYNEAHSEMPLEIEVVKKYMFKWCIFATMWGVSGSMTLAQRQDFGDQL